MTFINDMCAHISFCLLRNVFWKGLHSRPSGMIIGESGNFISTSHPALPYTLYIKFSLELLYAHLNTPTNSGPFQAWRLKLIIRS